MPSVSVQNPKHFSIESLDALKFETPFLVMDLNKIEQNYKKFSTALPTTKIYYALKCNPAPAVLRKLANLGSCFEIASANELQLLLRLGIEASKVIYSNPVKPSSHIQRAYDAGVFRFAFDSESELKKIAEFAPGSSVYLRYVVNDQDSSFPLSKKFGAEPQDILHLMSYAKSLDLVPYGLTFHVGSQAVNPKTWETAIMIAGGAMKELKGHNIKITMLNLGGGFPARYTSKVPSVATISGYIKRALSQYLPYSVETAIEPGRAIAANAGVLVSTIIGRAEHGGKNWLYLDVGAFNGMMESLESDNRFYYPIKTSYDTKKEDTFTLTGPTCDSQDTLFYDINLPENLDINDRIYIFSAGAYTTAYASSFNGFKVPETHYIK